MACCLVGAKPLGASMLKYCQLDPWVKKFGEILIKIHTFSLKWVSEWVSEWLNLMAFLVTVDSNIHIVHISHVITAYTLESLSSLTQITHNLQATIYLKKKGIEKITTLSSLPTVPTTRNLKAPTTPHFHSRNAIWKMVAILSLPQCVNWNCQGVEQSYYSTQDAPKCVMNNNK